MCKYLTQILHGLLAVPLALSPFFVLSPFVPILVYAYPMSKFRYITLTQPVRLVVQPGPLVAILRVLHLHSNPVASGIALLVQLPLVRKLYPFYRELLLAYTTRSR